MLTNFTYFALSSRIGENMRKIAATLLMALLVGLIASASAAEKVTVSGSTTVLPLAEVEGEAFNGQQSDCQVTVT